MRVSSCTHKSTKYRLATYPQYVEYLSPCEMCSQKLLPVLLLFRSGQRSPELHGDFRCLTPPAACSSDRPFFLFPCQDGNLLDLHSSSDCVLILKDGLNVVLPCFVCPQDDILLNFDPSDRVMILGRVGMGLTMLVAITMLVLPCRDIVFTVMDSVAEKVAVRGVDVAGGR